MLLWICANLIFHSESRDEFVDFLVFKSFDLHIFISIDSLI